MGKTYYMHTLDGQPAYFGGEQLYFLRKFGKAKPALVESLKQIRKQQYLSNEHARGFGRNDEMKRYGYVRVATPTSQPAESE